MGRVLGFDGTSRLNQEQAGLVFHSHGRRNLPTDALGPPQLDLIAVGPLLKIDIRGRIDRRAECAFQFAQNHDGVTASRPTSKRQTPLCPDRPDLRCRILRKAQSKGVFDFCCYAMKRVVLKLDVQMRLPVQVCKGRVHPFCTVDTSVGRTELVTCYHNAVQEMPSSVRANDDWAEPGRNLALVENIVRYGHRAEREPSGIDRVGIPLIRPLYKTVIDVIF